MSAYALELLQTNYFKYLSLLQYMLINTDILVKKKWQ